jgi:hypothetical protein
MRHFGDIRAIDRLGDAADFSLSHGAVPMAAEQVLSDIATFEAEKAAPAIAEARASDPGRPAAVPKGALAKRRD